MPIFLAFLALDQLKLGGIFLRVESLMIDVESMFDASIGCFWQCSQLDHGFLRFPGFQAFGSQSTAIEDIRIPIDDD